jgi:hypothetical protein
MTVSSAIMIDVHIAKASVMYLRVVISSLAKRLDNLLFAIFALSFEAWPKDHYMPLQRFTMDRMLGLAKAVTVP